MGDKLPKNWVETELGNYAFLKNGYAFKSNDFQSEGLPVVKISNIKGFKIEIENSICVDENKLNPDFIISKGDILIAMSGATTGKYGVFEQDVIALQNQRVGNLKPVVESLSNRRFLLYLLGSLKKEIEEKAYGAAQPNISPKLIESINIFLPPLAEQNRIVEKLDRLFAQLETIKTGMAKVPLLLKDFRQQVLMQAVTGKLLKINQFTELGKLEIDIRTGPFGSALHKSDYIENGVSVINPSHINNGMIIPDTNVSISNEKYQKLKVYKLINNDVILGRRGEMGRAALYNKSYGNCICGTGSIILRCGSNLYPKFLTFYLRSPFCIEYLNSNSVGTTMINLNQKIIKSLKVPNVSYLEQQEIVSRVESLFAKADAIELQYKSLKAKIDTLPQAILHKAFKGELSEQLDTDGDARELLKQIQELKKSAVKPKKATPKKVKNYPEGDGVLGMVAENK